MQTIDEWRKKYTKFSETYLGSYAKVGSFD